MSTDDLYSTRTYRVKHVTTYRYIGGDVTTCFERGMLELRDTPSQRVLSADLSISPEPDVLTTMSDHFGNRRFYCEINRPYRKLAVTKLSDVEVTWPRPDLDRLNTFTVAEAVRHIADTSVDAGGLDPLERSTFVMPSPLVCLDPQVREFALTMLAPDRPLGDAVMDLVHTIFGEFKYTKGVTSTRTTLPEVLAMRAGVCQDFAHLAVGALRSVGLPARYVSGYIETRPAPGKVKLAGSDATHAWNAVAVPSASGGVEWLDMDPTNNHLADSRYIVTGWGRDFTDVSPLRGIVFSEAKSSSLKVGVDVIPLT